ncbi:MAG: hypothetical protein K5891_06585 [Lachnospiraceae bacterium]|nr:hypothetical protein [Lachnospiraceae bacterium]
MAATEVEKGTVIAKVGYPLTHIRLVLAGTVEVTYPGGKFVLKKGDVLGICEVCNEVHFLGYAALEKVTYMEYPLRSLDQLKDLLKEQPELARVCLMSLFRQNSFLLEQCSNSEVRCSELYRNLVKDMGTYTSLSTQMRQKVNSVRGYEECTSYLVEEAPDLWLADYYSSLIKVYSGGLAPHLVAEPNVSLGMIRKGSLDCRKAFQILEGHEQYRQQMASVYFSEDGEDLFGGISGLYYHIDQSSREAKDLYEELLRICEQYSEVTDLSLPMHKDRIAELTSNVKKTDPDQEEEQASDAPMELVNSLNEILIYAGADWEDADSFRRHISTLRKLKDIDAMDDDTVKLRKAITQEFYGLYTVLFIKAVKDPNPPLPVKMFLYFGYCDEELAGPENCQILAKLARSIKADGSAGVYTLYDWLLAIYEGRKNPSRDEFESDYNDYLHKQQVAGNITPQELQQLASNPMGRVGYEMKNLFPMVNRMTFGRITTFCPIFAKQNVLKDLESTYVTAKSLGAAIEKIRTIDFSAFYRESLDKENIDVMSKEPIHLEYLPDIILMPNVGVRGVMWQEIEGKVRNSPARMCVSIFHMDDLQNTMIRLAGEFRWEMCKRVQGARWNDITDKSLTSEYFDYVQFYRKNRDLSNEAKEKVKNSLQRAKNSFKEMFVRDYLIWILFEAAGSPRLNKVSKSILFTYCPFRKEICDKLMVNPLYQEPIEHYRFKEAQRLHRLDTLSKKIVNMGRDVPGTLKNEILYAQGIPPLH